MTLGVSVKGGAAAGHVVQCCTWFVLLITTQPGILAAVTAGFMSTLCKLHGHLVIYIIL